MPTTHPLKKALNLSKTLIPPFSLSLSLSTCYIILGETDMDLTSSSTTTYTIGTDHTQTPPPTQPTNKTSTSKSLSFTNGTHKHHHHHHHPTTTAPSSQPPPSMVVFSYKECLKNHAASIGGHALDGCGEFMPSSSTNPTDPRSLKCAACGCHRNFHRRDPQEPPHSNNNNNPTFLTCFYSTPSSATATATAPPQPPPPPPLPHRGMSQSTSPSLSSSPSHSPSPMSSPSSPPPLSHLPPYTSSAPHMLLALGNNAYSVDEHHHHHHRNFNSSSVVLKTENNTSSSGKKRYRTKFSQEQKEKMYSFSEKLGWRMQKGDDGLVQEFCNDIGVPRGVFKVWMHNNKNTLRNKRSEVGNNAPQIEKTNGSDQDGNDGRGGAIGSDSNNPFNTNSSNNDIQRNEDSCVNVHVSINGLSS